MKKAAWLVMIFMVFLGMFFSCSKNSPASPGTATPTMVVTTVCTLAMGETGGTSVGILASDYVAAVAYTAPADLILYNMEFYMEAATQCVIGIYADNGGVPGALLRESAITSGNIGWNSVSIVPLAITSGTVYWIAAANGIAGGIRKSATIAVTKYFDRTWSEVQTNGLGTSAVWSNDGAAANNVNAQECH